MAGTTLFVASLGLSWLIDARQQHALVLPLYRPAVAERGDVGGRAASPCRSPSWSPA